MPELGGVTGRRAGLAQHPLGNSFLPPAARGSKPSEAAEAVTYGSPSHHGIDVSDRQIPCIVFYTDELATAFAPIKEGNINAVLFSLGFSICYL